MAWNRNTYTPKGESCNTCRYWGYNRFPPYFKTEEEAGKGTTSCMRYPPVMKHKSDYADYPNTPYYNWCGEWKPCKNSA